MNNINSSEAELPIEQPEKPTPKTPEVKKSETQLGAAERQIVSRIERDGDEDKVLKDIADASAPTSENNPETSIPGDTSNESSTDEKTAYLNGVEEQITQTSNQSRISRLKDLLRKIKTRQVGNNTVSEPETVGNSEDTRQGVEVDEPKDKPEQKPTAEILQEEPNSVEISDDEKVRLYRGDSTEVDQFDSNKTARSGHYGSGIYLTDNPAVAESYISKGRQGLIPTPKIRGETPEEAYENAVRGIAKSTAQRRMHRGDAIPTQQEIEEAGAILGSPDSIEFVRNFRGEWDLFDKAKVAESKGALTAVDLPRNILDSTIDAEKPITPDVASVLVGVLNQGLLKHMPLSVSSKVQRAVDQGKTFGEVWTETVVYSSHWLGKAQQKELQNALSQLGYTGIRYEGGKVVKGAEHNAYVIWDSQLVNDNMMRIDRSSTPKP